FLLVRRILAAHFVRRGALERRGGRSHGNPTTRRSQRRPTAVRQLALPHFLRTSRAATRFGLVGWAAILATTATAGLPASSGKFWSAPRAAPVTPSWPFGGPSLSSRSITLTSASTASFWTLRKSAESSTIGP